MREAKLPEPPRNPSGQFAWTIAITAIYMLAAANWFPKLLSPQAFSVQIVVLGAVLLVLRRKKRGPNHIAVWSGILVGFIVALAFSFMIGGSSPVPDWFNRNAGGLQAVAALAGLGILAFQSRFIVWQSQISAAQAQMSKDLLDASRPKLTGELVSHSEPAQIEDTPGSKLEGWGVQLYNVGRAPVDILGVRFLAVTPGQISAYSPRGVYQYRGGLDQVEPTEFPMRVQELGSTTLWLEAAPRPETGSLYLRVHRPGDADFIPLDLRPGNPNIEDVEGRYAGITLVGQAPYGSRLGPERPPPGPYRPPPKIS